MKTLDDFIEMITLSDEQRIEVVKEAMDDLFDRYFKESIDDSLFDVLIRKRMSDFIPETYIQKLDAIINKEQEIISSLRSDIARIQTNKEPTFYFEHLTDEIIWEVWEENANYRLWVTTEIGLHIYLAESIMSYAKEVRGYLLTLAIHETKKNYYYNISLPLDKAKDIYVKLTTRGLINFDYSFDEFQYFFSSKRRYDEPKNKMQWKGSIIDLVCLILILSRGFPEWTVTQKAFGVDADKLKSTASRFKKSIGYNKKLNDFRTKYLK